MITITLEVALRFGFVYFLSWLFRFIPLLSITLVGIIQTPYFWSWVAQNIDSELSIQKGGGIAPFFIHFEKIKHPSVNAENVIVSIDWAHFFNTFSWRLANLEVGLLKFPENTQATSPSSSEPIKVPENFLEIAAPVVRYIANWNITMALGDQKLRTKKQQEKIDVQYQDFKVSGAVIENENSLNFTLDVNDDKKAISAQIKAQEVQITYNPLNITGEITPGQWQVTDHDKIKGSGTWSPSHIDGKIQHSDFCEIVGGLNQEGWYVKPIELFGGTIRVQPDGVFFQSIKYEDYTANGHVKWAEDGMPFYVKADTPFGAITLHGKQIDNYFSIEGSAPYDGIIKCTVQPNWSTWQESSINGTISGKFDLKQLQKVLDDDHVVEGMVHAELYAKGSLKKPNITGHVTMENGSYNNIEHGIWLAPVALDIFAHKPGEWTIRKLEAQDKAARHQEKPTGYVKGKGFIHWNPEEDATNFDCNIKLELRELDIAHGDRFQSEASGELHIIGKEPTVKGNIVLSRASVQLEAMEDSEPVLIKKKKKPKKEKPPRILPLNIQLSVPGPLIVEGLGLESRWSGNMEARGYITDPYITGQLNCNKGQVNVLGIVMQIKGSSIEFIEKDKNTPQLHITAIHEISLKEKIFLTVNGPADSPTVELGSNMGLNQRDILAKLLFGQDSSSLSVWQSVQIANLLTTMNSRKNKMSFSEKLKQVFGVDALEVKSVETEDGKQVHTPSVAKRFGKVRVSVDAGTGTAPTKAMVETYVHPNVSVNADVRSDRSSGVGVDWVYSY